jgi:hypothetical protein
MESRRLFLDDERLPVDCTAYMTGRCPDVNIYNENWFVVRSFKEFVEWIQQHGLPDVVSFDHDIAIEHYGIPFDEWVPGLYASTLERWQAEPTGYNAALYLVHYCLEENKPLPTCLIHTMNTVGRENIEQALKDYQRAKAITNDNKV